MILAALALAAATTAAPPAIGPGETCLALRHLDARHAFTGRLSERPSLLLEVETPLCFPGARAAAFTRIHLRGAPPLMTALRAAAGRRVRLTGRIARAPAGRPAPLAMQVERVGLMAGLDDE